MQGVRGSNPLNSTRHKRIFSLRSERRLPAICRPTARRPKPAKLVLQPRLPAVVEDKLALRWSPQQIGGWSPLALPEDPVMRVSHETIYLSLFVHSRGALRRELQRSLRTGRAMHYPRASAYPRAAASSATSC